MKMAKRFTKLTHPTDNSRLREHLTSSGDTGRIQGGGTGVGIDYYQIKKVSPSYRSPEIHPE